MVSYYKKHKETNEEDSQSDFKAIMDVEEAIKDEKDVIGSQKSIDWFHDSGGRVLLQFCMNRDIIYFQPFVYR